jgi:mannan endo-1,4-beta-mannosidase
VKRLAALVLLLLTGCGPAPLAWKPAPAASLVIGVYEKGVPVSYSPVSAFTAATGIKPRIVLYYSSWHEKFWTGFAEEANADGAIPFVEIEPAGISLQAITAGGYDKYLRTYAKAVRAFGHPVILAFGHEMNGTWYSWGADHVTPTEFIAAWRHVVQVFRAEGVSNVTWMWAVSSVNRTSSSLQQWWPGAEWVDAVGVDGYYYRPSDTFASVIGTTVNQIRRFTGDPILLSETAVGPTAGPGKIAGLFAGVRADHLIGLVWFDDAQHDPPIRQNWRLEDSPAALAAFRTAARSSG